jgi:hypothetical protein
VAPRALVPARLQSPLPAPPSGTGPFIAALLAALTGLDPGDSAPAPALVLDGARGAAFRMPHSGTPFLDLFRRRFLSLHGEIWPVEEFGLVNDRNQVGLELPRTRCFARGLVIAVPRNPLRRFLETTGTPPRWLRRGMPVAETPARLFRTERSSLPVGLGTRVILADTTPGQIHWLSFNPDPVHEGVEWLVVSGPGAARISPERALGDLAPFSNAGIVSVDPGTEPRWDLDTSELRFPAPEPPTPIRHRAPVALVGAEAGPGLGPEGEILQARRVAIRLANRLRS